MKYVPDHHLTGFTLIFNQAKRQMGKVMQLASFSLAEVTYATGDISYLVQEQAKSASFRVKAKQENVSGVVLSAFEVDRASGSGTFLCTTCDILTNFLSLMLELGLKLITVFIRLPLMVG